MELSWKEHRMMKYTIGLFILGVVVCGAYYCGVTVGRTDAVCEYVTKQAEMVKNVEKRKAAIYRVPNADRDSLLDKMRTGEL